jgi:hypothetical protein
MRTSGTGNERLMTLMILGIALGISIVVFGGPEEFATAVDRLVRDAVQAGAGLVR